MPDHFISQVDAFIRYWTGIVAELEDCNCDICEKIIHVYRSAIADLTIARDVHQKRNET